MKFLVGHWNGLIPISFFYSNNGWVNGISRLCLRHCSYVVLLRSMTSIETSCQRKIKSAVGDNTSPKFMNLALNGISTTFQCTAVTEACVNCVARQTLSHLRLQILDCIWTVSPGLQIRVWYLSDNRQNCYFLYTRLSDHKISNILRCFSHCGNVNV